MSHHINITRIKAISRILKSIKKDVVFVGGATVSLYADSKSSEVRPTDDVDVVIELAAYNNYTQLEEELRNVGFENDKDSGIICRYMVQGIIVDIMPTNSDVLGFSNRWYEEGFENAISIMLDDDEVKIFSFPYFIATKLEAFKNRGNNDFRFSSDFEDIVYVLENNSNAENQLSNLPEQLKEYFSKTFQDLINQQDWEEGLHAHLEPRNAPQKIIMIENILKKLIENINA